MVIQAIKRESDIWRVGLTASKKIGNAVIRNRIKIYCIVKGDSKLMSIALASILAKETRDTIMYQQHILCPYYNFKNNVGYGTKEHREMILKHGITKFHRRNFKPISTIFCTCLLYTSPSPRDS